MGQFFRKLDSKNRWDRGQYAEWVGNSVPADMLDELATIENALSVWKVADDNANLRILLAAASSNRDALGSIDYVILSETDLANAGFSFEQNCGKSLDVNANNQWHFDIIRISADKLASLASIISNSSERRYRAHKKEVLAALITSIKSGRIELDGLPQSVREKVRAEMDFSTTRADMPPTTPYP